MRTLASGVALLVGVLALTTVVGGRGAVLPPSATGAPTATAEFSPTATFSLSVNGVTPAAVSLTWTASTESDFTNYTVYAATAGPTGPWTAVWSSPTESDTSTVVPNLAPGTTYWWNVTSYYTTGLLGGILGGPAESYSTVVEKAQPTVAYLTETVGDDEVSLAWTNNASYGGGLAFDYYLVEETDDGTLSTAQNITSAKGNATSVDLTSGHSYSFYILTYDACTGCAGGVSETASNAVTAGAAAPLVASAWVARSPVDTGLPAEFTCAPAGGTPPYAYAWNFTDGSTFTPGAATVSRSFAVAGTETVICQVTDHALTVVDASPVTVVVDAAVRAVASVAPANVTAGETVDLRCEGLAGTVPFSIQWALGNGHSGPSNSPGSVWANDTVSYASAGTYEAQCSITDAAGGAAGANVLVHVLPRPKTVWPPAYLVLSVGGIVGTALAILVGVSRRRTSEADRSSAMSRWLPPAGPATTVRGAKTCPKCGASNLPIRRTCQACGSPLPRNPSS